MSSLSLSLYPCLSCADKQDAFNQTKDNHNWPYFSNCFFPPTSPCWLIVTISFPPIQMSGFLNISDTLAAARQRAAHSDESLRSLVSLSSTGFSASGQGVTSVTVGRQMADSRGSPSLDGEGLSSGEFTLWTLGGSGNKDLPVVVLYPESISLLCFGIVSGSVKFCIMPKDKCCIQVHLKKLPIEPNTFYIGVEKNWNMLILT